MLAGITPAIYKALDLDQSLTAITKHANNFKVLQDRFRQAWRVSAHGPADEFKKEFDALMARMDDARSLSLVPPERFFKKAQKKIQAGHYDFNVDIKGGENKLGCESLGSGNAFVQSVSLVRDALPVQL